MADNSSSEEHHPDLLSSAEAAELLHCHPSTFRARVRKGLLTPVMLEGSKVQFFRKEEVVALKVKGQSKRPEDYPVRTGLFPVVAIGTCATGLEVIQEMLKKLPTDLGMAYLVITDLVDNSYHGALQENTTLPVLMVKEGMLMEPDRIYVIPPNKVAGVEQGVFRLVELAKDASRSVCPVDQNFKALAAIFQNKLIAVLLNPGEDGVQGCREIRQEGGVVIAGEGLFNSSNGRTPYMDRVAADIILSADRIGGALAELQKHMFSADAEPPKPQYASELKKILILLHQQRGVDFSQYKPVTIHRRIHRRMGLTHFSDLGAYYKLLRENKSEVDTLYNDLLINVTTFFRDPLVFRALSRKILRQVMKGRMPSAPLRIWVPGCSSGEEVISIAITLLEFLGDKALTTPVQIFATDLNDRSIEKARLGIYKRSAMASVSPRRLKKYFTEIDGHYQVVKSIRDMCVFARHDLIKDPPFSDLDIISCQNLLIYLENVAQAKILRSFHYALKPTGFLILGRSETPAVGPDLFQQTDRTYKVYIPQLNITRRIGVELTATPSNFMDMPALTVGRNDRRGGAADLDLDREADRLLLERLTPACVVVNHDHEIVRFRGNTNMFLEHGLGKPTLNVLKLVRIDLVFELRTLLRRAAKERIPVHRKDIPSSIDGIISEVDLEVVPFAIGGASNFLVLFRHSIPAGRAPEVEGPSNKDRKDRRIKLLEQELHDLRGQMRMIGQEYEAATEELRSANEEVVSSNEELQSINEELETSKEELQSINEEFATINDELQLRNDALRESEERLRLSVQTGRMGIWDWDMVSNKISWTDALYEIHGVTKKDFDPNLSGFQKLIHPDDAARVQAKMEATLARDAPYEMEFRILRPDGNTAWLYTNATVLRENGKPIRLLGAALDITDRKNSEFELRDRTNTLETLNEVGHKLVAELELNAIVQAVTDAGRTISKAQFGAFFFNVKDGKGGSYMLYTLSGLPREAFDKFGMPRNTAIFEPTFSGRGPVRIADVLADSRYGKNPPHKGMPEGHPPVRSYLAIPVISRSGQVLGGLFFGHSTPAVFTQDAEDAIIGLAAQAAMAIDNADLYTSLQRELEAQQKDQLALRSSEERLSHVIQSMPMAVFSCDAEGRIEIWNEYFSTMVGQEIQPDNSEFKKLTKLFDPNGAPLAVENYPLIRTLRTGEKHLNQEVMMEFVDGRRINALVNPMPVKNSEGKVTGAINVIIDISERKLEEQRRQQDADRLQLAVSIARLGVWSYNFKTLKVEMDDRCREIYGVEPAEVTLEIHQRIVHPEDIPNRAESMQRAMDPTSDGRLEMEHRIFNQRDGSMHWVRVMGKVTFENNAPAEMIGTVQDITEKKFAQEAILESEEKFRMLADNMDQLAWIANSDGLITWFNKRWHEFTGLTMDEIRDTKRTLIFPDDKTDEMVEMFSRKFRERVEWEEVFQLRSKEGKLRWFLSRATPIRNEEGEVERWFGTNTDITDRVEMEEQLRENEERFRLMADNMDQLAWIANADLSSFWFNKRWEEFSGM